MIQIDVLFGSALEVNGFNTEVLWDHMEVDNESYSGRSGPGRVQDRTGIPSPTPSPTDLSWSRVDIF